VAHIISKIRRFGIESKNPYDDSGKTNLQLLQDEIGDVEVLLDYLYDRDVISAIDIISRKVYKRSKLQEYSSLYVGSILR
jgi:hypothetical protein